MHALLQPLLGQHPTGAAAALEAIDRWHAASCWVMIATGAAVLLNLLISRDTAAYGRYSRGGWGFMLGARFAWVVSASCCGGFGKKLVGPHDAHHAAHNHQTNKTQTQHTNNTPT